MDLSAFGLDRNPFQRHAELDELCVPDSHGRLVVSLMDELRGETGVVHVEGATGSGLGLVAALLSTKIPRAATLAVVRAEAGCSPLTRLLELLDPGKPAPLHEDGALARLGERLEVLAASGQPTAIIVEGAEHLTPAHGTGLARLQTHVFLFSRAAGGRPSTRPRGPRAYLTPRLAREEALAYLVDRVAAAGGDARDTFAVAALSRIANAAGGRIGRLEDLAGACLVEAATRGAREVSAEIVETVVGDAFASASIVSIDSLFPDATEPAPSEPAAASPSEEIVRLVPGPIEATYAPGAGYLREAKRRKGRALWLAAATVASLAMAVVLMGLRVWPESVERREPVRLTVVRSEPDPVEARTEAPPLESSPPAATSEPEPVPAPPETTDDSVPVPPPIEAREAPRAREDGYVVQVGAFHQRIGAERLRDRLRLHDDRATLHAHDDGVYHVVTRPLTTRTEARELERALQGEGFSTYVRRACS